MGSSSRIGWEVLTRFLTSLIGSAGAIFSGRVPPSSSIACLEKAVREKVVELWTAEQKSKIDRDPHTGISVLEAEQLEYLVNACTTVWQDCLNTSSEETRFLYLKKRKIGSPHTIQLFKDGKTWIHVRDAYIGSGKAKKAKLISEWNTKKQFAKLSIHTHTKGSRIVVGGEEKLKKEISFSEMLKGRRGIVQLIDTFHCPAKNVAILNGQKTVLIQERYTFSLDKEIPPEVMDKWTEKDVQLLTLDLLHGLKAYEDNNLYDGDFTFGNVLVQLDGEGHIVKAGFTDFEEAEVLTEKSRKEFNDPLVPAHDIPSSIIDFLSSIYEKKELQCPEVLKEGFYKQKGSKTRGLGMFGQQYAKLIEELDNKSPTFKKDFWEILKPYGDFEHIPTKNLQEMITELENITLERAKCCGL